MQSTCVISTKTSVCTWFCVLGRQAKQNTCGVCPIWFRLGTFDFWIDRWFSQFCYTSAEPRSCVSNWTDLLKTCILQRFDTFVAVPFEMWRENIEKHREVWLFGGSGCWKYTFSAGTLETVPKSSIWGYALPKSTLAVPMHRSVPKSVRTGFAIVFEHLDRATNQPIATTRSCWAGWLGWTGYGDCDIWSRNLPDWNLTLNSYSNMLQSFDYKCF